MYNFFILVFGTFVNFKMPKSRSSIPTLLKNWIAFYNKTDHTIFTMDGSVVFGQLCDKKIVCTKKLCDKTIFCTKEFQLKQHVNTALHNSTLTRRTIKKKKNYLY